LALSDAVEFPSEHVMGRLIEKVILGQLAPSSKRYLGFCGVNRCGFCIRLTFVEGLFLTIPFLAITVGQNIQQFPVRYK